MTFRWLNHILALILGAIFIYAATIKITEPTDFGRSIASYEILPYQLINMVAIILPWLELCCGITISIPSWRISAGSIIAGMLLVFVIALSTALFRGLEIYCGCFGSASSEAGLGTVLFDVALIAAAAMVVWNQAKSTE